MADEKKPTKPKKPKINPKRTPMPKQNPDERVRNFDEVALGFTPELAILEAARCLQCKKPQCVLGCPVEVDIPGFISKIVESDWKGAAKALKAKNALPAVCGRVCPQEEQCEIKCVLGKKMEPVAIGRLERFTADYEAVMDLVDMPEIKPPTTNPNT